MNASAGEDSEPGRLTSAAERRAGATHELATWNDRIQQTLADNHARWFNRAAVLETTASTQDAAIRMCGGRPGLIVTAGRQTAGRGRLGRVWSHIADLGVAITFVLRTADHRPSTVALAAGVASAHAAESSLPPAAPVGIRWPNDVVERTPAGPGRKLSGVLIEASGELFVVGIGVNIGQRESDWPTELRRRAVSLRQLGSRASRIEVVERLVAAFDRALSMDEETLAGEWQARDLLLGRECAFIHDGNEIRGVVEAMAPTLEVVVRDQAGGRVRLPAQSTSLVLPMLR